MKNVKHNTILKAVVAFAVALTFIMPVTTAVDNKTVVNGESSPLVSPRYFKIENTTLAAGSTLQVIQVTGAWDLTISGYNININYDPSVIHIVDCDISDTRAGNKEWAAFFLINESVSPAWAASSVVDFSGLKPITANSGLLMKFIVNVSADALNGDSIISFNDSLPPRTPVPTSYMNSGGDKFVGDEISGKITITGGDSIPNVPSNPVPADGAVNVPLNQVLSWTGGDPDSGDTVTYDVYLGTTNPPTTKVSSAQAGTTFTPTLAFSTKYYWKIVSTDNHHASAAGPVWSFTTKDPDPNLDASGDLTWVDVPESTTVNKDIQVKNIGDAGSKLDWVIQSKPDWGTWTFTPASGTNLTPAQSPSTVSVSVVAPDIKRKTTFTGTVVIANSENSSDTVTLQVSMAVPYKPMTPLQTFINWLVERFPRLEPFFARLL
jgi:hypothetical protein